MVPEVVAGHVRRPVTDALVGIWAVRIYQITVVLEHVTLLDHLYHVVAVGDAQREVSLMVGGHSMASDIGHLHAVAQEANATDGNARTFIHHRAGEDGILQLREDDIRGQVAGFVELHLLGSKRCCVASALRADFIDGILLVHQITNLVITRRIGDTRAGLIADNLWRRRCLAGPYRHARHTYAIGHAHIATHHAGRLAGTFRLHAALVLTKATGNTLDGIDIAVLRGYRAVYVLTLQVVSLQRVGIHTLVSHLVTTHDEVAVGSAAVGLPLQRDTALLCLGLQAEYLNIVVKLIFRQFILLHLHHVDNGVLRQWQCRCTCCEGQTETVVQTG